MTKGIIFDLYGTLLETKVKTKPYLKLFRSYGSRFLIKDKEYEVESVNGEIYKLSQKEPLSPEQYEWNSTWFHKLNFETIEDKRDRKLKELGI